MCTDCYLSPLSNGQLMFRFALCHSADPVYILFCFCSLPWAEMFCLCLFCVLFLFVVVLFLFLCFLSMFCFLFVCLPACLSLSLCAIKPTVSNALFYFSFHRSNWLRHRSLLVLSHGLEDLGQRGQLSG